MVVVVHRKQVDLAAVAVVTTTTRQTHQVQVQPGKVMQAAQRCSVRHLTAAVVAVVLEPSAETLPVVMREPVATVKATLGLSARSAAVAVVAHSVVAEA